MSSLLAEPTCRKKAARLIKRMCICRANGFKGKRHDRTISATAEFDSSRGRDENKRQTANITLFTMIFAALHNKKT